MSKFIIFVSIFFLTLFFLAGCDSNPVKPDPNRGDINLNGVPFEFADYVLYSNYFIYGPAVFTVDQQKQKAATDINIDGKILTVADFVYLSLIVNGNATIRPKVIPLKARYEHKANGVLKVFDVEIGAASVIVEGNTEPYLLASNMRLEYAYDGTNTRILIYSHGSQSFTGEFISVYAELKSLEMATFEGQPVIFEEIVRESFFLNQNYPNPFSAATVISAGIDSAGQITFIITDATGRTIYDKSGYFEAGIVEFVWNGTNNAGEPLDSGIYYCSATYKGITKKIKMNLIR